MDPKKRRPAVLIGNRVVKSAPKFSEWRLGFGPVWREVGGVGGRRGVETLAVRERDLQQGNKSVGKQVGEPRKMCETRKNEINKKNLRRDGTAATDGFMFCICGASAASGAVY